VSAIRIIGGTIVAGLGAVVAHELTHYVVLRAGGRDPDIDWWGLNTVWEGEGRIKNVDRLAAAAPMLLGIALAVVMMWPSGDRISLPAFVAWVVYTFGGVISDTPIIFGDVDHV